MDANQTHTPVKYLYIGQTGRTAHARFLEHRRGITDKSMSCPLYRHVLESHGGDETGADFQGSVVRKTRTNLTRLVLEAQEIHNKIQTGTLLNSKSEFRGSKLIRMVPQIQRF